MIRLHHVPQTRSMRSLWLLHELGVDFEVVTYPFDKTLREEPYRSLNPTGRVPTLELDDTVICESGAIAQVLCETFSPDAMGRPVGHAERADWLNWVHFAETISQHCAALTQQHVALYDDAMRSPIVMKLEAARLAKTLATVEAALDGPYLLQGGFSAADVGVGQAAYMAQHFVRFDGFDRLSDWYGRISARAGFVKSLPEGGGLYAKAFYPPWEVVT